MSRKPSSPSAMAPFRLSPDLDRVLTESEAAELLSVNLYTLRRRFRDGALPRVKLTSRRIGYRLSDLYRFLEQRLEQLAPPVRR